MKIKYPLNFSEGVFAFAYSVLERIKSPNMKSLSYEEVSRQDYRALKNDWKYALGNRPTKISDVSDIEKRLFLK